MESAMFGTNKTPAKNQKQQKPRPCSACNGRGQQTRVFGGNGFGGVTCPACHGSGKAF
jgi:DnaJ-class molecular chaperone